MSIFDFVLSSVFKTPNMNHSAEFEKPVIVSINEIMVN